MKHEIPLYAVNENPDNQYVFEYGLNQSQGRKLYADLYIDDKVLNVKDIDSFLDVQLPEEQNMDLPNGGREADKKWAEIMHLAEQCGFIMSAYGGMACIVHKWKSVGTTWAQGISSHSENEWTMPQEDGMH